MRPAVKVKAEEIPSLWNEPSQDSSATVTRSISGAQVALGLTIYWVFVALPWSPFQLVVVAPSSVWFLRQFTLEALLFAWLQKKGVSLHLLQNALLLNLSLKTPKGALEGFAVVNSHLCQNVPPRHLRSSREYDCRPRHKQGRLYQIVPPRKSGRVLIIEVTVFRDEPNVRNLILVLKFPALYPLKPRCDTS